MLNIFFNSIVLNYAFTYKNITAFHFLKQVTYFQSMQRGWHIGDIKLKTFSFQQLKIALNVRYTCVIFSRFALGFRGASVSSTGCSSGATRSSL